MGLLVGAAATCLLGAALLRLGARRGEEATAVPAGETVDPTPPRGFVLPATFGGVGAPAFAVAFSPDGRLLAAAGSWKARVWDLATGEEVVPLEDAGAFFVSLAFRPDGRQLAGGGLRSLVRVWDVPGGKLGPRNFLTGEVKSLAYTPDGKRLVSASIDWYAGGATGRRGKVAAWDPSSGSAEVVFSEEAEWLPVSVACSPDGKQVAAGMIRWDPAKGVPRGGAEIRVWEAHGGRRVHTLAGPPGQARLVAYSPDGRHLRCVPADGGVWGWDAETGRPLPTLRGPHAPGFHAFTFDPDGRRLAYGGGHSAGIWDLERDRSLFNFRAPRTPSLGFAFSPDGRLLASADEDGLVRVWDASKPPAEGPSERSTP